MAEKKSYAAPLLLLLLLVVMPAVSWYYLREGFQYRKDAILTQGDFGSMPDLSQLAELRGTLPEDLRGSMVVVGWLDPTKEETTRMYGSTMDSLYQQFAESPNLHFATILLSKHTASSLADFTQRYHLPEDEMLSFLQADERQFAETAEAFHLPLGGYDAPGETPVVALVDSSQTIVKYYNLAQREETISLVELISLIIPLPEKQDLILDRGREL